MIAGITNQLQRLYLTEILVSEIYFKIVGINLQKWQKKEL